MNVTDISYHQAHIRCELFKVLQTPEAYDQAKMAISKLAPQNQCEYLFKLAAALRRCITLLCYLGHNK